MARSRPAELRLPSLPASPALTYAVLAFALIAFFLLQWPVIAFDTDLWYHLSGGRFIVEHGRIPSDSWFSFVEPPRAWLNYYWLFQVAVYRLYQFAGYAGLALVRAVVALAVLAGALWLLLRRLPPRQSTAWMVFIALCCWMVVMPRLLVIRPHVFTYGWIVLSLLILEHAPRRAWWLIPIGGLWANLHGVTYPVLWLIVGAYGAEAIVDAVRRAPRPGGDARPPMVALALAALSPLLTPHGPALLRVPLTPTDDASEYIRELARMSVPDIFSFQIDFMQPTHHTVFNVLLWSSISIAAVGVASRRVRVSHLLLWAGGIALTFRGYRFMSEYALLALPMFRAVALPGARAAVQRLPRPAQLAAMAVAMLLPLRFVMMTFLDRPAYPVSFRDLPRGIVTFLQSAGADGRVLNYPDTGGYLEWALVPRYRIFMDMQIPFLFTDDDMQLVTAAYFSPAALREVLRRYDPGFITVPLRFSSFKEVIKHVPDYAPVFFDDVEVLYAHRGRHPDLVAAYELKALDPYRVALAEPEELVDGTDEAPVNDEARAAMLEELRRVVSLYPACGIANHLLAWIDHKAGRDESALEYADAIIREFPESTAGHRIRGDALAGLGRYAEAMDSYQRSLGRANLTGRRESYRRIGRVHLAQGRAAEAYRLLRRATNLYSPLTKIEDLYYLGATAQASGHPEEARRILAYLGTYRSGDAKDDVWIARLRDAVGPHAQGAP